MFTPAILFLIGACLLSVGAIGTSPFTQSLKSKGVFIWTHSLQKCIELFSVLNLVFQLLAFFWPSVEVNFWSKITGILSYRSLGFQPSPWKGISDIKYNNISLWITQSCRPLRWWWPMFGPFIRLFMGVRLNTLAMVLWWSAILGKPMKKLVRIKTAHA